jgi:hypothetical protein
LAERATKINPGSMKGFEKCRWPPLPRDIAKTLFAKGVESCEKELFAKPQFIART